MRWLLARVLILIILTSALSSALAERFYYLGTLGNVAIQMDLTLKDSVATGNYYYDAIGLALDLVGGVDGNVVRLEEYTSADTTLGRILTGTFEGTLSNETTDYGNTFSGIWKNPQGSSFPFSLRKIAEYADVSLEQNRIAVKASYPFLLNPFESSNEKLQDDLLNSLFDFVREGQDYALAGEVFHGWWLERHQAITYASQDLVSLSEALYAYTGGAHGNTGLMGYTFGLIDGKVRTLKLKDFFLEDADYLAVLSPFVLEALRAQEAQWVLDGDIDGLGKDDLSVVTLSPTGLTFGFEPYAMGPYAQGTFFVTVPFETLKPIIDSEGLLARFLE